MAHLGIMPYVDRFSQNFPLARWSVSYLLVYTWHTLLHYPHGANAGCDLAGVAPVVWATGATPAKNTADAAGALRNALTTCNTLEGTKRFSGAVWISPRNGQRTS